MYGCLLISNTEKEIEKIPACSQQTGMIIWTDQKNHACSEFVNHKISSDHSYPFHNFKVCLRFRFHNFSFWLSLHTFFHIWHTGQNHVVLPILHTDTVNQAQYLKSWDILSSKLTYAIQKERSVKIRVLGFNQIQDVPLSVMLNCEIRNAYISHVHQNSGDNN